ncbi:MAG: acyl-CoA dehydrogenase family protein [Saprospiraceae bacterium]|nr:acyl-CoA dehydrogenase family protein [Saprospiraceae bacterium]
MSTNPTIPLSYSPAIQCLLPLIYVAWSDRVLSPTEVKALQKQAANLSFLSPLDKNILQKWSNPLRPPSAELFKYWEILLRKEAQDEMHDHRSSLVDLGLQMAIKAAGQASDTSINWSDHSIRQELEALENALQQISWNTYRSLFPNTELEEIAERQKTDFDLEEMLQLLGGQYLAVKRKTKQLLQDPVFNYKTLPNKEDYREQVLAWTKLLAEQGFGALSYPEPYGGIGDIAAYAALFDTLGHHDLSLAIKFGVQFGLFGGSVLGLGTKKHHDKYLKKIGMMELAGCFAMTETGHGSNVRGLETTAEYEHSTRSLIIHTPSKNAGKEYIGNALHGRMASVFAQLIVEGENHGVHAILVPMRNEAHELLPGITVEDCGYKLGLNGVDNGRIWFDQVRVPVENLLNRFGDIDEEGQYQSPIQSASRRFFTMLGTLVGGRVCVPRAGLSATKSALTIAIRYALRRRQFGANITEPETILLDYPSHQRRLMPLLAKTYALHFGLEYLTQRFSQHEGEDMREIETLAAGLKAYSTWFTTATIQECREACGGKGYLAENRFAALKADTEIFTTFEGDNTVLMQLVAKGVLTSFKNQFHEEGTWGLLRFLGGRIGTAITELNPIIIRNTDPQHLLSDDFQLSAFRYRESNLLYSLSQRMRSMIKSGQSAYQAALHCQQHMIELAEAFVERIVLEQFVEALDSEKGKSTYPALQQLCQLYALHTMEQHSGWYLEKEYISGAKSKAIRRLVDELCLKTRHQAQSLVAAFDIPDTLLGAQIIR